MGLREEFEELVRRTRGDGVDVEAISQVAWGDQNVQSAGLSVVWGDGGDFWCSRRRSASTVRIHSPGQKLYAKGPLIDAAGKQYEVWSPFTMN